jgi:hypothetical protein
MRTYELELLAADVGDVHVVGGRAQLLELLASEEVDGNQVDLCVSVLAGLGGGHVDDLARAVLDADEAVLPQSRALQRVGERSTSIGAVEGVLVLWATQLAERQMGCADDVDGWLLRLKPGGGQSIRKRWGKADTRTRRARLTCASFMSVMMN